MPFDRRYSVTIDQKHHPGKKRMKICIENIPTDTSDQEIRQLFSGYGKVQSVHLMPGPVHSKHAGTGLIELEGVDFKDIGDLPDRCLFKGTIICIRYVQNATTSHSIQNPLALRDLSISASPQPYSRTEYTLHIVSVEKVVDPSTGKSSGWCRYTMKSRTGSITGLRRGSLAEVTLHAEEVTEAFNIRNMLRHRKPPIWHSHHKK